MKNICTFSYIYNITILDLDNILDTVEVTIYTTSSLIDNNNPCIIKVT